MQEPQYQPQLLQTQSGSQFTVLPLHTSNGQPIEYWVCSDIHGCVDHLKKALDFLQLNETKKLIVLGDVLDRGVWDNCIECLCIVKENPNIYMCLGNHELRWRNSTSGWMPLLLHAYLHTLGLGFQIDNTFLCHCFLPRRVLEGKKKLWLLDSYCLEESKTDWKHKWNLPYTLVTGHIPARFHKAWKQGINANESEIVRYGSRILIDGGTPTYGVLPLYCLTHDYDVAVV